MCMNIISTPDLILSKCSHLHICSFSSSLHFPHCFLSPHLEGFQSKNIPLLIFGRSPPIHGRKCCLVIPFRILILIWHQKSWPKCICKRGEGSSWVMNANHCTVLFHSYFNGEPTLQPASFRDSLSETSVKNIIFSLWQQPNGILKKE